MAVSILNSVHSFVRFDDPAAEPHCIWGSVDYCLPVYEQEDIYFQFVLQGTAVEVDSLCSAGNDSIEVALVADCDTEPLIIFTDLPQRFRLSDTQVLFNWPHGLPDFTSVIDVNACFKIQLRVTTLVYGYPDEAVFCSNCFERISDNCYTSVIEYGNDSDAFGFKYCAGGDLEGEAVTTECEPTIVQFLKVETLTIPYTVGLQNRYGNFPTVQVWVYDSLGQLINMSILVKFDTFPPTEINIDFGGSASGIVVIR